MGDMRRVPRVILPAVEDHAYLAVAGECLNEVGVEVRLAPCDDDQPSLGGLPIHGVLFRVWERLHGSTNPGARRRPCPLTFGNQVDRRVDACRRAPKLPTG